MQQISSFVNEPRLEQGGRWFVNKERKDVLKRRSLAMEKGRVAASSLEEFVFDVVIFGVEGFTHGAAEVVTVTPPSHGSLSHIVNHVQRVHVLHRRLNPSLHVVKVHHLL
jgi:hypothetical protein